MSGPSSFANDPHALKEVTITSPQMEYHFKSCNIVDGIFINDENKVYLNKGDGLTIQFCKTDAYCYLNCIHFSKPFHTIGMIDGERRNIVEIEICNGKKIYCLEENFKIEEKTE